MWSLLDTFAELGEGPSGNMSVLDTFPAPAEPQGVSALDTFAAPAQLTLGEPLVGPSAPAAVRTDAQVAPKKRGRPPGSNALRRILEDGQPRPGQRTRREICADASRAASHARWAARGAENPAEPQFAASAGVPAPCQHAASAILRVPPASPAQSQPTDPAAAVEACAAELGDGTDADAWVEKTIMKLSLNNASANVVSEVVGLDEVGAYSNTVDGGVRRGDETPSWLFFEQTTNTSIAEFVAEHGARKPGARMRMHGLVTLAGTL